MHEMSLAENVREIIEDAAGTQGFRHVRRIVLEGSVAEGAALEFVSTPGAGWCATCAQTVALHERYDPCPHCGAYGLEVRAGAQMRVSALEVD